MAAFRLASLKAHLAAPSDAPAEACVSAYMTKGAFTRAAGDRVVIVSALRTPITKAKR